MSILCASSTTNNRGLSRRLGRRAALTRAMLALSAVGTAVSAGTAAAQSSVNGQTVFGTADEPYTCQAEGCPNPWSGARVVRRGRIHTPQAMNSTSSPTSSPGT